MNHSLPILNLNESRYECTFGRGCDGICCREGRPLIYQEEIERLDAKIDMILPELRHAAQAVIRTKGYLTKSRRLGQRLLRKANGWCVFFNQGCVLHRFGAAEGDKFRYKPAVCSLFPIQADGDGNWYIRQWGFLKEKWRLFCLDPNQSAIPASESLRDELALAQRFEQEYRTQRARETEQLNHG